VGVEGALAVKKCWVGVTEVGGKMSGKSERGVLNNGVKGAAERSYSYQLQEVMQAVSGKKPGSFGGKKKKGGGKMEQDM